MSSLVKCLQPRFHLSAQHVHREVLGGLAVQERESLFNFGLPSLPLMLICCSFFAGCCTTNPCEITCPQGNLYPTSFDAASYGKFPDATCGLGSNFYTCTGTTVPFMGCCKAVACADLGGCDRSNLTGAYLGTDDLRSAYGAVGALSSSISARPTITTSAMSSTTMISNTATSAAAVISVPKKEPVAAIAGGAAGGALALAAVIGLLIYYFCHAKKSRKGHDDSVSERQSDVPDMVAAQAGLEGSKPHDGKWPVQFKSYGRVVLIHPQSHQDMFHRTPMTTTDRMLVETISNIPITNTYLSPKNSQMNLIFQHTSITSRA
jgi:hypothetical protein